MLAHVILLALCGFADDRDPAALMQALASTRDAEREEAAGVLEEMGRPALPALYAVRDTTDPDLRRRVALLIDLIERQRLLRATKVKLDFHDRPLADVVAAIKEQTGFPLVLEPPDDPSVRARRISLEAPQPVPFWQALDRLHAAGKVRHDPGVHFNPLHRAPVIRLIDDAGPPMPSDQVGPFRINLVRLHRDRQVKLLRPPAQPAILEEFEAELQVFAEPGLIINGNGLLILEAAIDDRGQDLRPESGASPVLGRPGPPHFDYGHASILSYHIPLRLPKTPGRRVERLKGYIPLTVMARTSCPIVVPIAGSVGKPFASGGITLIISDVQRQGETTTIGLEVRGEQFDPQSSPDLRPARLGDFRPPYRLEDHVQLLDAQGRVCTWNAGSQPAGPNGELVFLINLNGGPAEPPAELRYHGIVGAAAEIVFEFRDLPMP
jgi:hypothetical protein